MTNQIAKKSNSQSKESFFSIKKISLWIATIVGILWPFAVFFSWHFGTAQYLCVFLVVVFLVKIFYEKRQQKKCDVLFSCGRIIAVIVIALSVMSLVLGRFDVLSFYPVAVNLILLLCFGFSLIKPPSMIARFAALTEKTITKRINDYAYKVTVIWCCFFIVNGLISLYTVILGDHNIWLLWNGFGSYIAIATLMSTEYLIRRRLKNKWEHTPCN